MAQRQIASYEILGEVRHDTVAVYYKAQHPMVRRLVMLKYGGSHHSAESPHNEVAPVCIHGVTV